MGRRARAAWLVLETGVHTVVQFRGPILELVRLRADDPTRPVADALLDQRTLAGIGNL